LGLGVTHKGKFYILYQARVKESTVLIYSSVADPVCLFGSRFSDPGSNQNKKEERKIKKLFIPFFVALNITKLQIVQCFEQVQKKIWVH
jgi:hypothetical protein